MKKILTILFLTNFLFAGTALITDQLPKIESDSSNIKIGDEGKPIIKGLIENSKVKYHEWKIEYKKDKSKPLIIGMTNIKVRNNNDVKLMTVLDTDGFTNEYIGHIKSSTIRTEIKLKDTFLYATNCQVIIQPYYKTSESYFDKKVDDIRITTATSEDNYIYVQYYSEKADNNASEKIVLLKIIILYTGEQI